MKKESKTNGANRSSAPDTADAAVDQQAPEERQDDVRTDEESATVESDQLRALREEIDDLKDRLLRAHAEMDNLRKRTEREIRDARKFAIERFAGALLDVVDNLERALAVEEGNEAALREGLKMTLDAWHAVMRKFEMERIDAVGQPFDPHHHEALSHMPSEEHPEGTVVAQHVAGYKLSGRLLRPAKVLVSSGPAARDADEQQTQGDESQAEGGVADKA